MYEILSKCQPYKKLSKMYTKKKCVRQSTDSAFLN